MGSRRVHLFGVLMVITKFWCPGIGSLGSPRDSVQLVGINGLISFAATRFLNEHVVFWDPMNTNMYLFQPVRHGSLTIQCTAAGPALVVARPWGKAKFSLRQKSRSSMNPIFVWHYRIATINNWDFTWKIDRIKGKADSLPLGMDIFQVKSQMLMAAIR